MSTKDYDPAQDPSNTTPSPGDSAIPAATAPDAAAVTNGTPDALLASNEAAAQVPATAAADAADAVDADVGDVADVTGGTDIGAPLASADEAPQTPELPAQLPGDVLAARRIEMRLSIEELSARVKLAPRQLIALEANDFGSLPGMATTRGFIRSCAKALGMDPEPLLAMVANEPNPALGPMVMRRPLPQPGFNGRRYAPSTSHRRGSNKLSGLAAVVLIFVGTLAYVAWRNDWLQLPEVDFSAARNAVLPSFSSSAQNEPQTPAEAPAETASPAADDATESPAIAKPASSPLPAKPAVTVVPNGDVNASAASAPVKPAAPAAATAAKAAATTIDPARMLELKLREDAWVEVLTQNGERKLVSRLMKAGSTERVEMTEPVILVVGNAAGVDVTLRGQPVSLKAGTRDNVAKVNLK